MGTGGELNQVVVDYFAAGRNSPQKLAGVHSHGDVTLTRAYEPQRDRPVKEWVQAFADGRATSRSLTFRFKNAQKQVIDTLTFPVVVPVTWTPPEGAAGDSEVSNMTLVVAVQDMT
jgi:hypothetical protein